MKKILTVMLLAAFAVTAQGQQPDSRLQQLEELFRQQHIDIIHGLQNKAGRLLHTYSSPVLSMGYDMSSPWGVKALERRQVLLDSIRNAFAYLSKVGPESHMYELHKDGKDTIKYSYKGFSREAAYFDYKKDPSPSNYSGDGKFVADVLTYVHFYPVSTGIAKDDMQPFDTESFCANIQPVLNKFMKLKGAKAYPVHWQYDEGHPCLTTGTHYIIPSQYETEAQNLYRQMDSLAYNYLNSHPEQPYSYKFTSGFPENGPGYKNTLLNEMMKGMGDKNGNEFYLEYAHSADGNYHIFLLTSKGEFKKPDDWASLKSYINGKKVYIKGMEPKKEK